MFGEVGELIKAKKIAFTMSRLKKNPSRVSQLNYNLVLIF